MANYYLIKTEFKIRFKKIAKLMIRQFGDPYYQGVAAQLAFFMFLSIIPILIILSHVLGLFDLSAAQIEAWANISVEDSLLSDMLDYSPSGANTVVLVFIAIWAASRLQFNLIKATNYTLSDAMYIGKGFMRERIRAMASTAFTLIDVALTLVVMVYGRNILKFILKDGVVSKFVDSLLGFLGWPIALAIFFIFVSTIFYNLPSERPKYKDMIPGSIVTSLGLLLLTFFFSVYTKYIVNYNILYGTFSSLIALMFFFWFTSWIMLGGIVFNRVWWATRKENPIPIGEKARDRQNPMGIL